MIINFFLNLSLEFDYYSLGDLVKIKYGKNQKKVQDDDNGKYPIYGTGGLIGYSIEYLYDKPSVLIGRKGSIEKVRYIDEPFWTVDTLFYTEVNEEIVIPKFLYYIMSQINLGRYNEGTSIPSLRTETLNRLDLPIPYLDYQNRVLSILSSIDKKIEINEKINKNLTKLIDTNFKNYLLNFENYSENELVSSEFGLIPKGWEVNNLTGIANYQNGLAMQKFPPETPENSFKVLKIKELRQGFFDESSDLCSKNIKEECIVYDGDVIFSWSGSLLVDIWTGGTCGLNQHLFKVTSSNFDKWFYYCWTKFYLDQFILIAKDKATTMGHIKRQHLEESLVLIPDNETYNNLTNLFKPLFEYLIKNKIEIKKLQSLRDTLLPKLMSGEIDVSKINCDILQYIYKHL